MESTRSQPGGTTASPPTISTLLVWPILEAARRIQLDLALTRFHLDPDQLLDPDARIPHAAADELLHSAMTQSRRLDFPLVAASLVRSGHFGLVELLSHSQPTVDDSLATMQRFGRLLCDGVDVTVRRGPNTSDLGFEVAPALTLHPASYDYALAVLFVIVREQTPVPILTPVSVQLPYPTPPDASHLERFFGCPVQFSAARAGAVLPTSYLDLPMRRASAETRAALQAAAESLLSRNVGETSFVASVRSSIRSGLATGALGASHVGRRLHMSERTLRRRLREEQTSFRDILDDVRREAALELLRRRDLSTEAIAELLQFSSAQALHRAFRKWTGMTIREARARSAPTSRSR